VLAALERGLAGVTIFGPNIAGPEQLAGLTAQLRSAGGLPLVAIDEEGGDVTRIAHLTGSPYPGNAALGAVDDAALTAAVHRALGQDLADLGINVDLAPSVDVNTAADNPVIGSGRSARTRTWWPGTPPPPSAVCRRPGWPRARSTFPGTAAPAPIPTTAS